MRSRVDVLCLLTALTLGACGGSSTTSPGDAAPAVPTGVTATTVAANRIDVGWTAVANATGYDVLRAVVSGGPYSRIATTTTPAFSDGSGLSPSTTYYYVVQATNAAGASGNSAEVSARTPDLFVQADLQGTWRYSILAAGAQGGWSRGTLTVDATGQVTVSAYLDQDGGTAAPAGFFPTLLVDASGRVRDAQDAANVRYAGDLARTNKNLIVATASSGGTSSIAILQKHDPTKTFSTAEVAGWGSVGGARKFVYDQISTGAAPQEWEFAAGQIGQISSPDVQYASGSGGTVPLPYVAPSSPTRPTNKITTLSVTTDGIVSETVKTSVTGTQPEFLVSGGFLSDDTSTIVAVGLLLNSEFPTPPTGARHALRVYHVTNVNSSSSSADGTTATTSDIAATYAFRRLVASSSPLTASGTLSIDASGIATFASYADSTGSTTAPGAIPFTMLPESLNLGTGITQFWGVLTGGTSDPTLYGKLSYAKDLIVFTQTIGGASAITFALR